MDFLYLFRDGPDDELRHSIRSLCRHFRVDSITMVGDKPDWMVDANHVAVNHESSSRYNRVRTNLHRALGDCPDRFVLMNDDFFVMRNTTVPNWHLGPLHEFHKPPPVYRAGGHGRMVAYTAWLLREWGHRRPLNYAIHAPMKIDRDKLAAVLDAAAESSIEALSTRTLYGNVAEVGGSRQDDPLYLGNDVWLDDDPPWISTTDHWWAEGNIGRQIRDLYPDPCRFESNVEDDDGH